MKVRAGIKAGSPILIAGDGRSGTTLLSVILDSHPELSVGPELHFRGPENLSGYILEMLDIRSRSSDEEWERYRHHTEQRNAFHFIQRVSRFGVAPSRLRELILHHVNAGEELDSFRSRSRLVEDIALEKAGRKQARLWGFKIMRDLPLFKSYLDAWPRAVFIHIIRDGRDVAASQMIDHAGWGYRSIEEAAQGWRKMLEVSRKLPAKGLLEIRYEDLVSRPEETTRRIAGFVGVEWHENFLSHSESDAEFLANPLKHPSGLQVSRPLSGESIGRYARDLPADKIKEFERLAGDLLAKHGYELKAHG